MSRKLIIPNFNDVVEKYRSGLSLNQISKDIGVSRRSLVRNFQKKGIHVRSYSESERLKWQSMKTDRTAVIRQLSSAWKARRGSKDTMESMIKRASTRWQRLTHRFLHEDSIASILKIRGLVFDQQRAIGPYNVDLAYYPTRIAVEIVCSQLPTKRLKSYPKRAKYILDDGWFILFIHSKTPRIAYDYSSISNQIIRFCKLLGRDKSLVGQYGVIDRNGKPLPASGYDIPGRTNIFRPDSGYKISRN